MPVIHLPKKSTYIWTETMRIKKPRAKYPSRPKVGKLYIDTTMKLSPINFEEIVKYYSIQHNNTSILLKEVVGAYYILKKLRAEWNNPTTEILLSFGLCSYFPGKLVTHCMRKLFYQKLGEIYDAGCYLPVPYEGTTPLREFDSPIYHSYCKQQYNDVTNLYNRASPNGATRYKLVCYMLRELGKILQDPKFDWDKFHAVLDIGY